MPEVKGKGIFESLRMGVQSDEEIAIQALFPTKDPYKMLQMITEQQPRAIMPWNVLGVFRRMYKSKILAIFQEEHGLNKISQERKGRLELSEIVARARAAREKEEE